MIYRTFDEWTDLGYIVLKGSKATWVDNKPVFSEEQVVDLAEIAELRLIAECTNPNG